MQRKYYNSSLTIYQIVKDCSFYYIYALKTPEMIESVGRAWIYLSKYNNENECIKFIMQKIPCSDVKDLYRYEVPEHFVNQKIQNYSCRNLKY